MTNMVYVVYCEGDIAPTAVFSDRDLACDLCDELESLPLRQYRPQYWVADLPILNSVGEYKELTK